MSNYSDYQQGHQAYIRQCNRIARVETMTAEQLDDAMEETAYCADGVPIGQKVVDDREYRNAVAAEIRRRYAPE